MFRETHQWDTHLFWKNIYITYQTYKVYLIVFYSVVFCIHNNGYNPTIDLVRFVINFV